MNPENKVASHELNDRIPMKRVLSHIYSQGLKAAHEKSSRKKLPRERKNTQERKIGKVKYFLKEKLYKQLLYEISMNI